MKWRVVALACRVAVTALCGCAELVGVDAWNSSGGGGPAPAAGSGAMGSGGSAGTASSSTSSGAGGGGGCGAPDDPENCGGCGKSCLGGACVSGHCQPLALVDQPLARTLSHIALDEDTIYFVQDGAIMTLPKSVTSLVAATTLVPPSYGADFIAVDDARVYWTHFATDGSVNSVDKTSKLTKPIGTAQDAPLGLALSATHVYWTLHLANKLYKAPLDGSTLPSPVADTGSLPFSVAVDGAEVYWTWQGTGQGGVSRFNGMTTVLAGNHPSPSGLTLSATTVYWIDLDGSVHSVPRNGGAASEIAPAEGQIFAGEVQVDATHVYWTGAGDDTCVDMPCDPCGDQPCSGKIWRAELGGSPEVFAAGDWHGARSLEVDDAAVYWTTSDKRLLRKSKAAP